MKPTGIVGIILVIIGIILLAYGWFGSMTFSTKENVAKLGPLEINKENEHSVPVGPIVGGVVLVGGIILLITSGRKA